MLRGGLAWTNAHLYHAIRSFPGKSMVYNFCIVSSKIEERRLGINYVAVVLQNYEEDQ